MIKLQLNAEAINAVLASSGEEIKLELQSAIVQEFSGKYLKGVIQKEHIDKLVTSIKKHINEQFGELGVQYYTGIILNEKTKKAIEQYYKDNIDRYTMESLANNQDITKIIEASVKKALNNIDFSKHIQKVYDDILKDEINNKVTTNIKDLLKNVNVTSFIK